MTELPARTDRRETEYAPRRIIVTRLLLVQGLDMARGKGALNAHRQTTIVPVAIRDPHVPHRVRGR